MLKKNARFERMVAQGFRPGHGIWIDTYNRQFGGVLSTPYLPE